MNTYTPPTMYICPHRTCERGQSKVGCHHYSKHEHHKYCGEPCPKNGATCITMEHMEKLIKEKQNDPR